MREVCESSPACFNAGESFTPSPVIAVTLPALVNSCDLNADSNAESDEKRKKGKRREEKRKRPKIAKMKW